MEFEYGTPEYKEWMAKADEAKEKCTQEAFDALPDLYGILNNKIGMNLTYDAGMKKDYRGREYINIKSSDLSLDGWTKFLFRNVALETFNSSVGVSETNDGYDMSQEPKANYWMTVGFEYDHTGGGSNGHDFATCWFEDGQWKVRFVDEDELVTSSRKTIKSAAKNAKRIEKESDRLVAYSNRGTEFDYIDLNKGDGKIKNWLLDMSNIYRYEIPEDIEKEFLGSSRKAIESAKSQEDFEEAVIEIADFFEVNAEGNRIPLKREITDVDWEEGLFDICRKYNVNLKPSSYYSHSYVVVNSSRKAIKSSITDVLDEEKVDYSPEGGKVFIQDEDRWNNIEEAKKWFQDKGVNLGWGTVDGFVYYGFEGLSDEQANKHLEKYWLAKDDTDDDFSDLDYKVGIWFWK